MNVLAYIQSFLAAIGAIGIAVVVVVAAEQAFPVLFEGNAGVNQEITEAPNTPEEEKVEEPKEVSEKIEEIEEKEVRETAIEPVATVEKLPEVARETPGAWEVSRVKNPYGIPERSLDDINTEARAALVNIFCQPRGALSPITASGVFISANGAILTNAHVAQYVLLEQSGKINMRCAARMGAPARDRFYVRVLYVPAEWVHEHAHELRDAHALGTGEHDWALLYAASSTDGSTLPATFSHVPPDVRSAIGFEGDAVLAASYPAGFLGGQTASMNLYPASAPTNIQELMTFSSGSVDIFSVGGTVTAQGGSSGGAVVNMWGYIIGLVTTMREGKTTAERDLRALTLNYINADLEAHTGSALTKFISGDLVQKADAFMTTEGDALTELLLEQLK